MDDEKLEKIIKDYEDKMKEHNPSFELYGFEKILLKQGIIYGFEYKEKCIDSREKYVTEKEKKYKQEKLYTCDPWGNTKCTKEECFLNGGQCFNTVNKKFALNIECDADYILRKHNVTVEHLQAIAEFVDISGISAEQMKMLLAGMYPPVADKWKINSKEAYKKLNEFINYWNK